jgi:hypothetical protein
LGTVGLVGDNDDICPLREGFINVAFFGLELLDGGKDDAPGGDFEQRLEMVAVVGLHRLLPQQLFGSGEGVEELVVEIVAVGDDDDGGVVERLDDFSGVEDHREGLAAALGVPDDARFAVPLGLLLHAGQIVSGRVFFQHARFDKSWRFVKS